MEAITIHPESEEQFETVKAVLKALKVPFESHTTDLPEHVLNKNCSLLYKVIICFWNNRLEPIFV